MQYGSKTSKTSLESGVNQEEPLLKFHILDFIV